MSRSGSLQKNHISTNRKRKFSYNRGEDLTQEDDMNVRNTERRKYVLNVDFTSEYGESRNRHVLHLNRYEPGIDACNKYDPFRHKKPEDGGPIFLTPEMARAILGKPLYWFWNKKEITGVTFCPDCQKKPAWDLSR
jgi:hypothetical protein